MKRNITIITIALKVLLIALGIYIGVYFLAGISEFTFNGSQVSRALLSYTFTPIKPTAHWAEGTFMLLYTLLNVYLFNVVNNFRLTLKSLRTSEIFEHDQAEGFRRAGRGLIIFAKLEYLLICGFGSVALFDLVTYFTQFVPFMALYIIGKFILILAEMLKRGELLREETELTI